MISKIETLARKEAATVVRYSKASVLAANVFLPAAIAVWLNLYSVLSPVDVALFWIPMAALVLAQAVLVWIQLRGPHTVQEAYFEARSLQDRVAELGSSNERLVSEIGYLSTVQEAAFAWHVMLRGYVAQGISEPSAFIEAVDEIMSIAVGAREKLFAMESGELWNFSLYVMIPSRGKLVPVWRDREPRHPSVNKGREWGPGQGHIGKAYADRSAKITNDATDPDVAGLLEPPEPMRQAYDDKAYRSFASIPVGLMVDDADPFGVLVATSDRVGRFNKGNCLILRHAALVLTHLAYYCKLDPEKLLLDDAAESPTSR